MEDGGGPRHAQTEQCSAAEETLPRAWCSQRSSAWAEGAQPLEGIIGMSVSGRYSGNPLQSAVCEVWSR